MTDGDRQFEEFVASRYGALVRAAFVLTADRGHAEDLVQSALLRSYPAWRHGGPESPEAYVRKAMVRLALRWRRRKLTGEVAIGALPEVTSTDDSVELHLALRDALATLSVAQRAVIVLRHLAGLSEAETAQVLKCSVGTVKSRNSRALAALRDGGLLDELEDV